MLRAVSASLALHALLLGGLVLWMSGPPARPDAARDVKVELMLLEKAGSGLPSSPIPPVPPAPARATAPAVVVPHTAAQPPESGQTQPSDAPGAEALPLTLSPPPARSAGPPPVLQAPPGVRPEQGGTDSLANAVATGDDVIPARADARYRNRPPAYPAQAVESGQQGAVTLLIHVSPAGLPTEVDITESSGSSLLDQAAREAVETWHFVPALRGGAPIAGELPLRVRFSLQN